MTANIRKDGKIVFRGIDISMTDARDLSSNRQWEGTFCIPQGDNFDVSGDYRLELDDGRSAYIVLTHVLRRERAVIHFRVFAWKDKPHPSTVGQV